MCLRIKSGPHKAKEDFYVVKILEYISDKGGSSPYQGYKYKFGKKVTSKLAVNGDSVDQGLHVLRAEDFAKSGWVLRVSPYLAWHASMGCGFVLCKIPKGATYYIGTDCDIVTDQLLPLYAITTTEANSKAIEGGEQTEYLTSTQTAKLVEKYVKDMEYETKPQ